MSQLDPIPYSDAQICAVLERVRTIAMVGASSNWNRPSYFVMKYLQGKGYRVIPVNPGIAGQQLLGERVYNFWRDDTHERGIWRRTSLASYRTAAPQWETVLDVDALAKGEGKAWVFHGANCLPPAFAW